MKAEDSIVRLERFKAECARRGIDVASPTALVGKFGRTPSFWSDLVKGHKSFGEKLARALEEQMNLPRNALDILVDRTPVSFGELNGYEGQLVTMFRALAPAEQQALLRSVQAAFQAPRLPPPSDH